MTAILKFLKLAIRELKEAFSSGREVTAHFWARFVQYIILKFRSKKLQEKMLKVDNYKSWEQLAKILDQVKGNMNWKLKKQSKYYEWERIENRYKYMKKLRKSGNIKALANSLRQDLQKNLANICNE